MVKREVLRAVQALLETDPLAATDVLGVVGRAMRDYKDRCEQRQSAKARAAIDACVSMRPLGEWRAYEAYDRAAARLVAVGLGLHHRQPSCEYEHDVLRFCAACVGTHREEAVRHLQTLGAMRLFDQMAEMEGSDG